jgi:hypothetical protein
MAGSGRRNADEALALALAAGQTLRESAAAAGVAERTATRRWADAAFRRRVSQLRADMVARALGKLADGMAEAGEVLRKRLAAESESVRLGACRAPLEHGVKLRETVDHEERLQALEKQLTGGERSQ